MKAWRHRAPNINGVVSPIFTHAAAATANDDRFDDVGGEGYANDQYDIEVQKNTRPALGADGPRHGAHPPTYYVWINL